MESINDETKKSICNENNHRKLQKKSKQYQVLIIFE
jgi:hypothetical protein